MSHILQTLILLSVPLVLSVNLAVAASAKNETPNVILIMTDDQGYGDFGATGNKVIQTPHLDNLAAESTWFTNFYVSPVCSPTRACLMTGRYNHRTGAIDTFRGRSMMEPEEVTLAEVLAAAGYRTGIFGKWHLGDNYPLRPQDQGFQEVLVHRGGGLAQPSEPIKNNRRYTNAILFQNGQQIQTEGYCTDVYFQAATDFIDEAATAGQPFFAYIATNAPHGPFHDVPEDLRYEYQDRDVASLIIGNRDGDEIIDRLERIAAMITNIDDNIGRLMEHLASNDLQERTLVIFLVDNGPDSRRYVGPFRGNKSNVHEGGIRSPLWLHWPSRFEAGRKIDTPAAHIDILPTVAAACNAALPDQDKVDGRNLMPLIDSDGVDWPERDVVIQSHRGDSPQRYHHFMIRRGDWKLVHPSGFGKERFSGEPQFELYDVSDDPGETSNLADEKPELVAELRSAYDRWFDDVSSTRPDNYTPPRIVIGSERENPTVLTLQEARYRPADPSAPHFWRLSVAKAGDYRCRVIFRKSPPDGTLVLRLGSTVHEQSAISSKTEYQLPAIQLTAGEIDLEAGVMNDGKMVRNAYHVEVERL